MKNPYIRLVTSGTIPSNPSLSDGVMYVSASTLSASMTFPPSDRGIGINNLKGFAYTVRMVGGPGGLTGSFATDVTCVQGLRLNARGFETGSMQAQAATELYVCGGWTQLTSAIGFSVNPNQELTATDNTVGGAYYRNVRYRWIHTGGTGSIQVDWSGKGEG